VTRQRISDGSGEESATVVNIPTNDDDASTDARSVVRNPQHCGIILCGGRSSRMGRSKADLPFGNESMLQRVTRLLSTVVRHIVVVAAAEQQIPDFGAVVRCPVTIARDDLRFAGPLAGLGIGLRTLPM
jgi:molybdopterin-guanine dinucleotide biosynthesis protein A